MKKNITFMCIAFFLVTSAFAQQSKKVSLTQPSKGTKVQADLAQAKKDSIAEYRKFKADALEQIEENNRRIQ